MPQSNHYLSILIPTYNDMCVHLVASLIEQASQIDGLSYEILVADDGSTSKETIVANQDINKYPHCKYLLREQNIGRSAIRNFLARQAQYDLLLFIDSHMSMVNDVFLSHYLTYHDRQLTYGGYTIKKDPNHQGNLRYAYELSCIAAQDAKHRGRSPYSNFHTSNFMIQREVMLAYTITHIDNPVGFARFESNQRFVEKTEEGLRTLFEFQGELKGYSRLLAISERLRRYHLTRLLQIIHSCLGRPIRNNLVGNHPSLFLFKVYKLIYFASLKE